MPPDPPRWHFVSYLHSIFKSHLGACSLLLKKKLKIFFLLGQRITKSCTEDSEVLHKLQISASTERVAQFCTHLHIYTFAISLYK